MKWLKINEIFKQLRLKINKRINYNNYKVNNKYDELKYTRFKIKNKKYKVHLVNASTLTCFLS